MRQLLPILFSAVLLMACNAPVETVSSEDAALSVIMSRKSVRSFTGEKLTRMQIETLLKAAMAAPTEGNVQPWEFVVIQDTSMVDNLFGKGHHAQMYKDAGAVIVVCGHTTAFRKPKGQPDAKEQWTSNQFWSLDCSAATENLLLAAEAMGLGAVWMTAYPVEGKMADIRKGLQLPEDIQPLSIVPVGYPSGQNEAKDKWKPEKIHFDRW